MPLFVRTTREYCNGVCFVFVITGRNSNRSPPLAPNGKVWTLSGGGLMQGKRGLFGSGSKVHAKAFSLAEYINR